MPGIGLTVTLLLGSITKKDEQKKHGTSIAGPDWATKPHHQIALHISGIRKMASFEANPCDPEENCTVTFCEVVPHRE